MSSTDSSASSPFATALEELRSNHSQRTSLLYSDYVDSNDGRHVAPGYGARLGAALAANTVVTSLTLYMHDLMDASSNETFSQTNLADVNSLSHNLSRSGSVPPAAAAEPLSIVEVVSRELAPLLKYLATNQVYDDIALLNRGSFYSGVDDHRVEQLWNAVRAAVLTAIHQNHGTASKSNHDRKLKLWIEAVLPLKELTRCLRETQSLVELSVVISQLVLLRDAKATDYVEIAAALAENTNLELLRLLVPPASRSFPTDAVDAILMALSVQGQPSTSSAEPTATPELLAFKLHKLIIVSHPFAGDRIPFPQTLPSLMQSPWSTLQTIVLCGCDIDGEIWTNGGFGMALLNCRVPAIVLEGCRFDETASRNLERLIRSTATGTTGAGRNETTPTDLSILQTARLYQDTLFYPPRASILFASPLQSSLIRVRSLALFVQKNVQLQAMAYYLPQSVFLRSLTLVMDDWNSDVPAQPEETQGIPDDFLQATGLSIRKKLLEGIRCNGSLVEFSVMYHSNEDNSPFFTDAMNRKLQAYLERNRQLPKLLSDSRSRKRTRNEVANESAAQNVTRFLHPPLLVSANVVAATTPTHVLRGLLSRSE